MKVKEKDKQVKAYTKSGKLNQGNKKKIDDSS